MSSQIISYEEGVRRLSVREINVLDVVEIGLTNKEIAEELNLSIRTIHAHRRNICEKLEIRGSNGLIKWLWKVENSDNQRNKKEMY